MPRTSVRALKKPPRLDDEVRFLRSWIEKPLHVGAVMPSGRLLARTMAQYVDAEGTGPVVELGPGTGAITSALIERGVEQKRLVLVEYNPSFCALLRDRYPQAKVVQGDAYTGEAHSGRLRSACERWAIHPVHLFRGAADPEIVARGLHGGLRADLDEPSTGPRLGVSQRERWDWVESPSLLCLSMISAQTRSALVAMEKTAIGP